MREKDRRADPPGVLIDTMMVWNLCVLAERGKNLADSDLLREFRETRGEFIALYTARKQALFAALMSRPRRPPTRSERNRRKRERRKR